MKYNNKGLTLVATIIIIVILLVALVVGIKLIFGAEGSYTQVVINDMEFDKGEVLESLQTFVSEAYLKGFNEANDDNYHLEPDEVITSYFNGWNKDNKEGEEWNAEKSLFLNGPEKKSDNQYGFDVKEDNQYRCYIININSLKRQITKYGKGENYENGDVFVLRRKVNITKGEDGKDVASLDGTLELVYKPANTKLNELKDNTEISIIGNIDIAKPVK